ncbi:MAG: hypothetical protein K2G55_00210 [Lachnospiraceae bacterium]|nr:hypothetical protein [Lachnospiraceae bacterium]MDE6052191.1 hypothetical protein [Lachnospiraceae bacterium]MDE7201504.1 hypothetical protein [Lachnospiraceae bacterium]MDE7201507.1 hypothetical protein [Lachnospiraceae bacterium]
MSKEEITLQITLKLLENFSYNVNDYGGNTLTEHAEKISEVAATLYNGVYTHLQINNE